MTGHPKSKEPEVRIFMSEILVPNKFYPYFIFGMPGMPGIPPGIIGMWLMRRPILEPVTIFIILRVWSNCLTRRFTSWMVVPEPFEILILRLVLRHSGCWRS